MNHDVPSLEACQRLVKAGYDAPAHHFYDTATGKLYGEGMTVSGAASPVTREVAEQLRGVLAPTVGEMLAEIRRREWQVGLDLFGPKPKNEWSNERQVWVWSVHVIHAKPDELQGKRTRDVVAFVEADKPADALANALAEAMEKEGKA